MQDVHDIFVFKTNVNCNEERECLVSMFRQQPGVIRCTIDLEDEDRVLRVVAFGLSHTQIIELMTQNGFKCHELI